MAATELRITVYGTADVKELNSAMSSHNRIIKNTIQIYKDLEASGVKIKGMFSAVASEQLKNINATLKLNQATLEQIKANTENIKTLKGIETAARGVASAKDKATDSSKNFLVAMLQYRLASAAFHEVTKAIHEAIQAYADYQTQVVRTTRIIGNTPANRLIALRDIERGATASNLSIQDTGEAYYQLATFIDKASDRAKAFDATMTLLTATEGDARDTTRLIVQLVEQFGDQMGRNLDSGTKYARMVELIATAFQHSHMEANEFANAMKYAGPLAAGANIPLEQIAGITMTLATLGQRARMAGTGIQQLQSGVIKSTLQGFDVGATHYQVPFIKTATGQTDILAMLRVIQETGKKLPTQEQLAYGRAVTGSVQGWRAFLALNTASGMQLLTSNTDHATKALNGMEHAAKDMQKAMQDTLPAQWGMAWKNVLTDISNKFGDFAEGTGIIGLLKRFNEEADRGRKAAGSTTVSLYGSDPRLMAGTRMGLLTSLRDLSKSGDIKTVQDVSQFFDKAATDWLTKKAQVWQTQVTRTLGGVISGQQIIDPEALNRAITGQTQAYRKTVTEYQESKRPRITFTHPEDRARVNPQLLSDIEAAATASGVYLNVSTAITGHQKFVHGTNRISRHPAGDALDINRINNAVVEGNPQLSNFLSTLKSTQFGFSPGEHGNQKAFLLDDGGHILHVSELSSSGKMQTGPSKSAAAAARKAARDAHTNAVRTAEDNFNTAKQDAEQWLNDRRDDDINDLAAAHPIMVRMAARLRVLEVNMHRVMGKGHASGRLQYAQRFENAFDKLVERAKKDKDNDKKDALTKLIDGAKRRLDKIEHYRDPNFISPEGDLVAAYIDRLTVRRDRLGDDEDSAARIEAGLSGQSARRAGERKSARGEAATKRWEYQLRTRVTDFLETGRERYEAAAEEIGGRDYSIYLNPVQRAQEEIRRQREILAANRAERGPIAQRFGALAQLSALTGVDIPQIEQLRSSILGLDKAAKSTTDGISKLTQTLPEVTSAYAISQLERGYGLAERGAARDVMPVPSWLQGRQDRSIMMGRLARARDYAAGLSVIATGTPTQENRQKAEDAQQALLDLAHEFRFGLASRAMQRREELTGQFAGGMVGLYRGTTTVGGMLNAMGGNIVDEAITSFSKKLFDPVAQAMLKNTEGMKDLTDSINALNSVMTGGSSSSPAKSAPGGVGLIPLLATGAGIGAMLTPDFSSVGKNTENYVEVKGSTGETGAKKTAKGKSAPLQKPLSQWKSGDYINAGMAAYNVFNTGAEHGVTLGNVLGAGMAGFSLGGPIGAGIGVGLDLLGGLFGHKKSQPERQNPAFYNSPSDFDYNFYKYRLTGIPQPTDAHLLTSNAPIVNVVVNMDGVKQAVQTQITQQTATATVSLRNGMLDNTRPI